MHVYVASSFVARQRKGKKRIDPLMKLNYCENIKIIGAKVQDALSAFKIFAVLLAKQITVELKDDDNMTLIN
jgi:urease gamma subunit